MILPCKDGDVFLPGKMERQRGSRVDWEDIFTDEKHLCNEQKNYERNAKALRMRRLGFTFKDVGEWFGISPSRASQMCRHGELHEGHLSPVEKKMLDLRLLPAVLADEIQYRMDIERLKNQIREFREDYNI